MSGGRREGDRGPRESRTNGLPFGRLGPRILAAMNQQCRRTELTEPAIEEIWVLHCSGSDLQPSGAVQLEHSPPALLAVISR